MNFCKNDIDKIYQWLEKENGINELVVSNPDTEKGFVKRFIHPNERICLKAKVEEIIQNDSWINILTITLGIFSIILANLFEDKILTLELQYFVIGWLLIFVIVFIIWNYYSNQKKKAHYILSVINSISEILDNKQKGEIKE